MKLLALAEPIDPQNTSETCRNSGWMVDGSRIQRNVVEDLEANPEKIEFTPGFCLLFLVTTQLFMSLESIVWSVFKLSSSI